MVNIAICDDEKIILDDMEKMVSNFFDSNNMENKIFRFSSGEELLESKKAIDILFLDIQMKNIDGLETAKRLRNKNFKGFLIFTTVLKEMVFQSFEVQAFDYLVKPIEKKYFERTMERLLTSIKNRSEEALLIRRGTQSHVIPFERIVFCEIINRKIYLHLSTADVVDYYDKLEVLKTKLDGRFFQCHRSYLINLRYLESYRNETAYMAGGYEIPVSRLRGKEFSGAILHYMKERRL